MKSFQVTVYRPRLERVTITVEAENQYEAENEECWDKAKALPADAWEMLPPNTGFYTSQSGFDPELFGTNAKPYVWDDEGNSTPI